MNTQVSNWPTFRELDALSNRLSQVFRQESRSADRDASPAPAWMPAVDIFEDENGYHLALELPGLDKKDVQVVVEDGNLVIRGERAPRNPGRSGRQHRIERAQGPFRRIFLIPEDADAGRIAAEFKNGLLEISLSKVPEAQPKRIEIKVA